MAAPESDNPRYSQALAAGRTLPRSLAKRHGQRCRSSASPCTSSNARRRRSLSPVPGSVAHARFQTCPPPPLPRGQYGLPTGSGPRSGGGRQIPQHMIPSAHWQAALSADDDEVLASCVVASASTLPTSNCWTEPVRTPWTRRCSLWAISSLYGLKFDYMSER